MYIVHVGVEPHKTDIAGPTPPAAERQVRPGDNVGLLLWRHMNTKPITELDVQKFHTFFEYDPHTGILTWKAKPASGIKVGAQVGEHARNSGYKMCALHGKAWLQHRVIWSMCMGPMLDACVIDHINGDPEDNRLENLRSTAQNINMQNRRKPRAGSKSGILGVSKSDSHKNWRAAVTVNRKRIHIGYFATPEAAHQAYLEAKRRLHPGCTL